jgi:hypothetical protein
MKRISLTTSILALLTVLAIVGSPLTTQAAAVPCADTKHVQAQLMALYGEVLAYSGRLKNSNILQLFMNERDESWSILVQIPSRGLSCIISSGHGFKAGVTNDLFDQVDLIPIGYQR